MTLIRKEESVKEFWQQYLHHMAGLCDATRALLVAETSDQWKSLSSWPLFMPAMNAGPGLSPLAAAATEGGIAIARIDGTTLMALRLDVGPQEVSPVLVLDLGPAPKTLPSESVILLAASIPSFFQISRQYRQTRTDMVFFAELMKLVGSLTEDDTFRLAAMRLCNETSTLFKCTQVSLGWEGGEGLRVKAISHLDQFEHSASAVLELETAMD